MKKKTIKEFCGMNNVTEYIESLDENTTIITHTIQGEWHYIITEKEVQQHKEETEIQKLEQLITSTQEHFMDDLDNCIDNMNFYYSQGNMTDYREYVKQYDGIMKRYGEKLKDLHKRLDKLKNV
ncbi:hypothetical protein [Enterococcus phage PMBT2]|uniref:Uncharacterized protein n=1 Tax=Enterococcus phage PMBT2 TaxID=2070197 RepID=A0A2I7QHN5_9CAUD|nr:tail length tape measure protein [Enterococcus phage PMBT2]AUR80901.1 hypothetical protein [Enterococcus phage PMBT2]WNA13961.1 hypothetical protein [Enterococcus phage vB_Efa_VP16]